ncbi:hypothetical protein [Neobacillus sp. DY30]|uniref:hypothetical protein n=1 Tax=Neobacillus sp. DY30 TaxID=3047871 RepID=UPI0024BFFF78|nr:hypothetical protein [Neobacillus sp. DY30]WHY00514.1 hypothetical protein QNH29_29010 [Neobacillus sp. DY30]
MKKSNQSIEKLKGMRQRARRNNSESQSLMQYFKKPIIHKEIHGDRVYVPLRISRIWNGI